MKKSMRKVVLCVLALMAYTYPAGWLFEKVIMLSEEYWWSIPTGIFTFFGWIGMFFLMVDSIEKHVVESNKNKP